MSAAQETPRRAAGAAEVSHPAADRAQVQVLPGPQLVYRGPGALGALPGVIAQDGIRTLVSVHGRRAHAVAAPHVPALPGIDVVDAEFAGECSEEEIERIAALVRSRRDAAVLGIGGGKALDTAKAVARAAGVDVLLVPTLASTCSAWSAVSVFYTPDHRHVGHAVWRTPTRALFVDPAIVFDAPVDLFVSGIADTLAKWVETRPLFEAATPHDPLTATGAAAAQRCRDAVLQHAATAVRDMRAGRLTTEWTEVAEAGMLTAGLVGSFGGEHGRATLAHPVGDALSAFPATRDLLHGVKVAYGILVQLAVEGRWDEISGLLALYTALGLPRSAVDLGLDLADEGVLAALVAGTLAPGTSAHILPRPPDAAALTRAVLALEDAHRGLGRIRLAGASDIPVPPITTRSFVTHTPASAGL